VDTWIKGKTKKATISFVMNGTWIGTTLPFQLIGTRWGSFDELRQRMMQVRYFKRGSYKPKLQVRNTDQVKPSTC
jgi:hypothetical protein